MYAEAKGWGSFVFIDHLLPLLGNNDSLFTTKYTVYILCM